MKNYIFIPLFLLCFISCKKEPELPVVTAQSTTELPPATQTGKNTFGFLLDGELWLPEVDCFPCYKVNASYGYRTGRFTVSATRINGEKSINQKLVIDLNIRKSNPLGEYQLDYNHRVGGNYEGNATFYEFGPYKAYGTYGEYIGKITLTRFDSNYHFYAGTFETKIFNRADSVERNITQGRFDIRL